MPTPQSWSVVSYGDVEFELRGTKNIKQAAVLDSRGNYMFTRWTLEFSAVLNPSATSYAPSQINGEGAPAQLANQFPAATSAAIREYLMQPRRKLVYRNGGQILLECPFPGSRVDSEAGPTTEVFNVDAERGTRTFMVSMRITCSVNEGWRQNALLSHTWETKAHYDHDWQPVIITRGLAVFDANAVQQLGTFPDGCRSSFLHPVAPGCRRETVTVDALDDGNTVSYEFVDRWQDFTIDVTANAQGNGPNGVFGYPTRFDATISAGYRRTGDAEASLGIISGIADAIGAALQPDIQQQPLWRAGAARGAAAVAGMARARMHSAFSQVPFFKWSMRVKCWGNAYSNRWDMICWACAMIASRQPLRDPAFTTTFVITEQLNERYIEVDLSVDIPVAIAPFLEDIKPGVGLRWTLERFSSNSVQEEVNGVTPQVEGVFNFGGKRASVVKDSTKGARMATPEPTRPPMILGRVNFFGKIVAQALAEPCQLPPKVATSWSRRNLVTRNCNLFTLAFQPYEVDRVADNRTFSIGEFP